MLATAVRTEMLEKGASALIYEKGDTSDPANFRLITFEWKFWYGIKYSGYGIKSFHPFMRR